MAGAEAACRAAITADPKHAATHYSLGVVLGERGDLAGAARSFAAALKIDPADAETKANLQITLRVLKEEQNAQ
jgi:Flp pilus assembly protein TadD